jgi:DNA topoisomerase-1
MDLIIVESPTKAKTIQKFLDKSYSLKSSYGHIRDLPKTTLGIDVENNFQPKYLIPAKSKKTIKELQAAAKKAKKIILATDEDREGEAIAWHLAQVLELEEQPYERIVFHEITPKAIKEALQKPRKIKIDLVNAQQARRVLDRIVGYKLSPFLWKKIIRGLSAGRVQSVAVRLIVDREKERERFIPEEYWNIIAFLTKQKSKKVFQAILIKKDGKLLDKLEIKTKEQSEKILGDLKKAEYKIKKIEKTEKKKNPLPPFTTSSLQQESWQKFKYPSKKTMFLAQGLYEKGFITYHRTDSLNLSEDSLFQAKEFIKSNFGENYWAGYFRKYKTKSRGAQEAHEAIRPTFTENTPEKMKTEIDKDQLKIYGLIWQRFVASQMKEAELNEVKAIIETRNYEFESKGQTIKFDGFLKIYPLKVKEEILPYLEENEILNLKKLENNQHFTKPPARYNEASLIKELEKFGIGRPSTYAPTMSAIQNRNYINKDKNRSFFPTELGIMVNEMLVKHFQEIVDVNFTAEMEKDLDDIAKGEKEWQKVIKEFYFPFSEKLEKKYETVEKQGIFNEQTGKKCPKCGSDLILRLGKFGRFYGCSKFPECKHTEPWENNK